MKIYILLFCVFSFGQPRRRSKEDVKKLVQQLKTAEHDMLKKFIARLREIASKDKALQTALGYLKSPKYKALKEKLKKTSAYKAFAEDLEKYSIAFSYEKEWTSLIEEFGKKHSAVAPDVPKPDDGELELFKIFNPYHKVSNEVEDAIAECGIQLNPMSIDDDPKFNKLYETKEFMELEEYWSHVNGLTDLIFSFSDSFCLWKNIVKKKLE